MCKVDLSGLGSFGREGGWQVAQVVDRLARWWTVSIPAAVPFGRRQRHIRFASFRPEQRPSRLRVLARPYPPTISIEIAEVVHRHRRVGMRHADGPQVPLKSKVRFQWNLRLLSAEADSMNVFAPGVTRPRKDSTVRVGRSSTTRIREAKNTRARLLDRPSRLEQPDDLPPETAPSSRVHRTGGEVATRTGFSLVPIVGSWPQCGDIFSCAWQEDPPKLRFLSCLVDRPADICGMYGQSANIRHF